MSHIIDRTAKSKEQLEEINWIALADSPGADFPPSTPPLFVLFVVVTGLKMLYNNNNNKKLVSSPHQREQPGRVLLIVRLFADNLARNQAPVAVHVAEKNVAALSVLRRAALFLLLTLEEHVIQKDLIAKNHRLLLRRKSLVLELDRKDVSIRDKLTQTGRDTSRTSLLDDRKITRLLLAVELTHREVEVAAELGASSEAHGTFDFTPRVLVRKRFIGQVYRWRAVAAEAGNSAVSQYRGGGRNGSDFARFHLVRTSRDDCGPVEAAFRTRETSETFVRAERIATIAAEALLSVTNGREDGGLFHVRLLQLVGFRGDGHSSPISVHILEENGSLAGSSLNFSGHRNVLAKLHLPRMVRKAAASIPLLRYLVRTEQLSGKIRSGFVVSGGDVVALRSTKTGRTSEAVLRSKFDLFANREARRVLKNRVHMGIHSLAGTERTLRRDSLDHRYGLKRIDDRNGVRHGKGLVIHRNRTRDGDARIGRHFEKKRE